jgi:hypothetical protein
MGILVNKALSDRSELQDKITADLREKAQRSSGDEDIDLAEDSNYAKHLKKTSRFGWVWFVLILLAVFSIIIVLII